MSDVLRRVKRLVSRLVWLLRPRLPLGVVAPLVRRRVRRRQADPARMEAARADMRHLLGDDVDPARLEEAARGYVEHWTWVDELRWHPASVTHQPVEGVEHLRAAHALGRGVVVSFVHHAHFDGVFGSVSRHGFRPVVLAGAREMSSGGPQMIQHLRTVATGSELMAASVGTAGIIERVRAGDVVALAIDVPGGSRATLNGRRIKCSSGVARAALTAEAPIVLLTSHRGPDGGSIVRLHPPILPEDLGTVEDLVTRLVAAHEGPLLDWPEAAYAPRIAWSSADD